MLIIEQSRKWTEGIGQYRCGRNPNSSHLLAVLFAFWFRSCAEASIIPIFMIIYDVSICPWYFSIGHSVTFAIVYTILCVACHCTAILQCLPIPVRGNSADLCALKFNVAEAEDSNPPPDTLFILTNLRSSPSVETLIYSFACAQVESS